MNLNKEVFRLIANSSLLLTKNEIYNLLPDYDKVQIDQAVKELRRMGRIFYSKKRKLALPEDLKIVVGRLQVTAKGYGFVLGKDFDLFISRRKKSSALNNDLVAAKILSSRKFGFSPEGEIIQIIERANQNIVGTVQRIKKDFQVIPSDRRIDSNIIIDNPKDFKLRAGNVVNLDIISWPDKNNRMKGKIIEVIGEKISFPVEIQALLREHQLETDFPEEVLKEAAKIEEKIKKDEIEQRIDYRELFTVTIDGLDARDFDDAVSLERAGNNFNLTVHIADVSKYVSCNSAIDIEALKRGFSVYLPDRVLPMLPKNLSNNICSLKPGQERLAFSVNMKIDLKGKVVSYQFGESIIKSDYRLNYEELDRSIAEDKYPDNKIEKLVKDMLILTEILEKKRLVKGSLNFETLEPKIIMDIKGQPKNIKLRERTPATNIIEEAMIITNQTVATFLDQRDNPSIYRIHERPDQKAIDEIGLMLSRIGFKIPANIIMNSSTIQSIIEYVNKRPEKFLINTLLLRAMKQARYSTASIGHYGLAMPYYTHFTSPIRRYPDLMIHRLIKLVINKTTNKDILDVEKLDKICEQSSIREREADEAEREATDLFICELMKKNIGEIYEGIISGVTRFGLFVQLPNSAEGLVHIRDLKGRFNYEPDRYLLREERTGKAYRLGDPLKVKLINVSVSERRLNFLIS